MAYIKHQTFIALFTKLLSVKTEEWDILLIIIVVRIVLLNVYGIMYNNKCAWLCLGYCVSNFLYSSHGAVLLLQQQTQHHPNRSVKIQTTKYMVPSIELNAQYKSTVQSIVQQIDLSVPS